MLMAYVQSTISSMGLVYTPDYNGMSVSLDLIHAWDQLLEYRLSSYMCTMHKSSPVL